MVMASSWSCVTWMKVRPDLGLDPLELELHLAAQLEVERAERLVEQQHLGPVDQGPGQRDALLLAAGELGRLAVGQVAQLDQLERLGGLGRRRPCRRAGAARTRRCRAIVRCGKSA